MTDIPDKVKIGPLWYKVILATVLEDEQTQERLWGEISYEHRTISLADGERQTQSVSLIHESLHGLLEICGIDMSESKVQVLAYALYGFLCENPTLFPGWGSDDALFEKNPGVAEPVEEQPPAETDPTFELPPKEIALEAALRTPLAVPSAKLGLKVGDPLAKLVAKPGAAALRAMKYLSKPSSYATGNGDSQACQKAAAYLLEHWAEAVARMRGNGHPDGE
jgi:hypothetical protein